MHTDPALAPKVIEPCRGVGVVVELALVGPRAEIVYRACVGCPDCARRPLAPSTPESQAAAFARLPIVDDGGEW